MVTHLSQTRFDSMGLHPSLLKSLNQLGYELATPIQAEAIPLLMSGKDVAGQAQTGTGKTNAFLLATLNELLTLPEVEDRRPNEPRAFIIAPTRELVIQIYEDAKVLAQFTDLKIRVAFGGADYAKQRDSISAGVDVLVGTVGRLKDYLDQSVYSFYALDCVVLDEADRMFDLGFIDDIRYFFRSMPNPKERLNMLFSATLSNRVKELAYEHMNTPTHIHVEPDEVTAGKIDEYLFYPSNKEKLPLLVGLMQQQEPTKSIVFTNTKRKAEQVWLCLKANGYKSGLLTGDVQQNKRMRLLDELKSGVIDCLIATDVAARGLHIDAVSHVFNFDLPDDAEDYVHRIGRTARAGASGVAISFACEDAAFNLPAIEKYIDHAIPTKDVSTELLPDIKIPEKQPRTYNKNRPNKRRDRY
jgi:ATP-dependent RNA helicase RhlB